MKQIAIAALAACLAIPAAAQGTLLTASPIPDGAESRFCYYGGLAYSRNAYILVGGNSGAAQVTGNGGAGELGSGSALNTGGQIRSSGEAKPLQCVVGEDGLLGWSAVATIQLGR